jgi:uncharacterized protein YdhG (YjbR/CyaY superfamily)
MAKTIKPQASASVDEYISAFPEGVQKILNELRTVIKKTAPEATEKMSYGIPTFILNGNLVHFAGWKEHIGFYPAPDGIEAFKEELARYKGAKGSIQFPLDEPIPFPLIRKIVKFRVKQNLEKKKKKSTK